MKIYLEGTPEEMDEFVKIISEFYPIIENRPFVGIIEPFSTANLIIPIK